MTEEELRRLGLTEEQTQTILSDWKDRTFEQTLERALERYEFSSKLAREAAAARVRAAGLELKDGELEGLDKFMDQLRMEDPEAFLNQGQPARFTASLGRTQAPTREQIIKIPDRARRRAAIAENMRLFKGEE